MAADTLALTSLHWGDTPVAVVTVRAGGRAMLGAARDALAALPDGIVRGELPIVRVEVDGTAFVEVPPGAVARVVEMRALGEPVDDAPEERCAIGPRTLRLARGEVASVALGAAGEAAEATIQLRVEVLAGDRGEFASRSRLLAGARAHMLAAAVAHALALGASSALALPADEDTSSERMHAIADALSRIEEKTEREPGLAPLDGHRYGLLSARVDARRSSLLTMSQTGSARPIAVSRHDHDDRTAGAVPDPISGLPGADARWVGAGASGESRWGVAAGLEAETSAAPPAGNGARLREGTLTVSDRARLDMVRRVLHQSAPRVQACGERGARSSAGSGEISIEFVILRGRATDIHHGASAPEDPPLYDCVVQALSHLSFPTMPEDGPITVRYPLYFSPRRG